jgi:heparan-alpha-glucosaminide N-acetyltransferase
MSATTVTNPQHISIDAAGEFLSTRIHSIDIFRGITLAVMIFVNDVGSTRGLPWWTHHAPGNVDVMTYVDMVYPIFLFLVGMSMPIAIKARLRKNRSIPALWGHVFVRSASLVILGLILANAGLGDPTRMHLSNRLWEFLGVLGCSLFLSVYPANGRHAQLHKILRIVGVALVLAMYAIFRRTLKDGNIAWIDGSYAEILGRIGYAYFTVCLLYIPTRKRLWAPFVWFIALVTFNALTTAPAHIITFQRNLPEYIWPLRNGSAPSLIMAGIVTTNLFIESKRFLKFRDKTLIAFLFAGFCLVQGYILMPLGISKIRATPTWCLYSIAFAVPAFALLYWICDVKKHTRWAFAFQTAGSNTLTTYLLPDYWGMILGLLGIQFFRHHFRDGWHVVAKSVIFTCLMMATATVLTKRKIRLAL